LPRRKTADRVNALTSLGELGLQLGPIAAGAELFETKGVGGACVRKVASTARASAGNESSM
jgi:hypothetical protein